MGLRFFFQGISGMNFQFYNAAGWLSFLDLPKTRNSFISDGFSDAGFDTISFFLGTADIVFVCLITFANYLVTRILLLVLGRFKYWNKKLTDKQQAFKGGVQFSIFLMSFMVIYLCALQNTYKANSENATEFVQSIFAITVTIVYTFVPFIGFLFTNLNIAKIKRGDKVFMNKFEAFYDGLDTERSEAIFFGPLQLLIRQIFVLNCFFNTDGPLLQIYLANCLLGTILVLQYLTWPFVANFRNKFELFMAAVTLLLSSSCVLFV